MDKIQKKFKINIKDYEINAITKTLNRVKEKLDTINMVFTLDEKVMCYETIALNETLPILVISHDIDKHIDKAVKITKKKIKFFKINDDVLNMLAQIRDLNNKIIYFDLDLMSNKKLLQILKKGAFSCIVLDNAGQLSQYSNNFKPLDISIVDYIASLHKRPPLLLFSESISKKVKEDLIHIFNIKDVDNLQYLLCDKNLYIDVEKHINKEEYLLKFLNLNKNKKGVIYGLTSKSVKSIYTNLIAKGFKTGLLLEEMNEAKRKENIDQILKKNIPVIISTNEYNEDLFNVDIDYIVFYQTPASIETLYDKICLAKRDEKSFNVKILFDMADICINKYLISRENINISKLAKSELLVNMIDFCNTQKCLQKYLSDYFSKFSTTFNCKNCSSCNVENTLIDVTLEIRNILLCINEIEIKFEQCINILKGVKTYQLKFGKLLCFGKLKMYSKNTIDELINFLIQQGFIQIYNDFLVLMPKAIKVLQTNETIEISICNFSAISRKDINYSKMFDKELFKILSNLRHDIAFNNSAPPFIVFVDSILVKMAKYYTITKDEMLYFANISLKKYEIYGEEFSDKIKEYVFLKNEDKESILPVIDSYNSTYIMHRGGKSISSIAYNRKLTIPTIQRQLLTCFQKGLDVNIDEFINKEFEDQIINTIHKYCTDDISIIKAHVPKQVKNIDIEYYILLLKKDESFK